MESFNFPPFELGKYRIIYLENTESIVKCTVSLNKTTNGNVNAMMAAYAQHEAEVTELVLRLLLLEEAYGKTDLALPDSFLIKHDSYTLSVATVPWTTPQRFRFFRKHTFRNPKSGRSSRIVDYARLVCWPFKYRFTFTPHSDKLDDTSRIVISLRKELHMEDTLMSNHHVADQEGLDALTHQQTNHSSAMSDVLAQGKEFALTSPLREFHTASATETEPDDHLSVLGNGPHYVWQHERSHSMII
ncbi:hypothetical protein QFC22_002706 [Naganishia vaughanmartiniae]|uniref:Uncharacterized protein n=1 Tax=Naganishia vaughanmartiniae TaxID=1424756 RepID=A0ACC2X9T2_9TREE|nr:hypothetical protein QFC22_002706 [Naganishia vaughanmartiniae]